MLYKTFKAPNSLDDALALLGSANGGQVRLLAGGTDLILQLHEHILSADTVIDISRIPEIRDIRKDGDVIEIGAAVTYTEIVRSPIIKQHAYLLVEASKQIGAAQIQNMATIGGNLGNASPAADAVPCLYALDAHIVVRSQRGERLIPVGAFHKAYRSIDLDRDELITAVRFRAKPPSTSTAFYKYGLRKSQAISVVNAAVLLREIDGKIEHAVVALGSVAPTIIRSPAAESILLGQEPSPELFADAGEAARADSRPISDIRGSADFRRHLVGVCVSRALAIAHQRQESTQEM